MLGRIQVEAKEGIGHCSTSRERQAAAWCPSRRIRFSFARMAIVCFAIRFFLRRIAICASAFSTPGSIPVLFDRSRNLIRLRCFGLRCTRHPLPSQFLDSVQRATFAESRAHACALDYHRASSVADWASSTIRRIAATGTRTMRPPTFTEGSAPDAFSSKPTSG